MTTTLNRQITISTFFSLLLTAYSCFGAKAPISEEDREKQSTHIITGKVVAVKSAIENAKIEKEAGNRDHIISIKAPVDNITKGKGLKKSDVAKFYLKKNGDTFEPLMPNGIDILAEVPIGEQQDEGQGDVSSRCLAPEGDEKAVLLPKSYSITTKGGEHRYNYTPDLTGLAADGFELRVWMTAEKGALLPGENLTLTVHYENISKKEIWVPFPGEYSVDVSPDLNSGAMWSSGQAALGSHSSPKLLKVGERSRFDVNLKSPIKEPGFVQIDLQWGILEKITPHPVFVECKK